MLGHVSVQATETELFPMVEGSHANRKLRNHQGRRNGATYSSGSDPALSAESANPSKRQTICRLIGGALSSSVMGRVPTPWPSKALRQISPCQNHVFTIITLFLWTLGAVVEIKSAESLDLSSKESFALTIECLHRNDRVGSVNDQRPSVTADASGVVRPDCFYKD